MIVARDSWLVARGMANAFKFYLIYSFFIFSFFFSVQPKHMPFARFAARPMFGTCECGPRAVGTQHAIPIPFNGGTTEFALHAIDGMNWRRRTPHEPSY